MQDMNATRYQALRNAADIENANHISVAKWLQSDLAGCSGVHLDGEQLDIAVDNVIGAPFNSDAERYMALRNRNGVFNEHLSVTFWEYNPNDSVNNGTDIFGEDMDNKIDKLFGLK